MWLTAQKRFVRHVCLRNPFFDPFVKSKPPYQKLEVPESGSTLHQLCIMVASVASCLRKIESWYPSFGLQANDCDLGCLMSATAASQWRIVEIEFLATVGSKWGGQPFICPCSLNVAHCQKEICSTCLSKESMQCVNIQASTPYQKLEAPECGSTLHQLCTMVASVASCLQKIELWYPRFGLQAIDCDLGYLIYSTSESQWRIVEIQLLATVGWKCGCQPFSCPCSKNVIHCPKWICSTCLPKKSIPAIPSWNSKHPISTRSLRFLRATVRSTSSALWLYPAHTFVASAEKKPPMWPQLSF